MQRYGIAHMQAAVLGMRLGEPYASRRRLAIHRHDVQMEELRERVLVDGNVREVVGDPLLPVEEEDGLPERRIGASRRVEHVVDPVERLFGAVIAHRGVEVVHQPELALDAARDVVLERGRRHDERRAACDADERGEHAARIVDAVVDDRLGEQRELAPEAPALVEARAAVRFLLAGQQLDGAALEHRAAGEPCDGEQERHLEHGDEQHVERHQARIDPRHVEVLGELAVEDGLDDEHRDDLPQQHARDDREGRVGEIASRDLPLAESEGLLGTDLGDLVVHDARHRRVAHEQADEQEERCHGDAQVVGEVDDVAEHDGAACGEAVVDDPVHRHHGVDLGLRLLVPAPALVELLGLLGDGALALLELLALLVEGRAALLGLPAALLEPCGGIGELPVEAVACGVELRPALGEPRVEAVDLGLHAGELLPGCGEHVGGAGGIRLEFGELLVRFEKPAVRVERDLRMILAA